MQIPENKTAGLRPTLTLMLMFLSITGGVRSQEDAASKTALPHNDQLLTFSVETKKSAAGGMPVPFEAHPPLRIHERGIPQSLRRSMIDEGVAYILSRQGRGGWAYSHKQVPRAGRQSMVMQMARKTLNRVIMTALVGSALRARTDGVSVASASSDQARAALAEARRFVVDRARGIEPWRGEQGSTSWTAALSMGFLRRERALIPAGAERDRIDETLRHLIRVTLASQHPGDLRLLVARRGDRVPPTIGIDHGLGFGVGLEDVAGARITSTGGMPGFGGGKSEAKPRVGDIIVSYNGVRIRDCWDYAQERARLKAGDRVEIEVLRSPRLGEDSGPRDGGWSYVPDGTASMLTAHIVSELAALRDAGFDVDADALARGAAVLDAMRFIDPATGAEAYRYQSSVDKCAGLRGAFGRGPLVELALFRSGRRRASDVARSLVVWLEHRHELDRVLHYWGTHVAERHLNAPYYFLYDHLFALRAARICGDPKLAARVRHVVSEALAQSRRDGTWTDHDSFGRLCGTCLAIESLALAAAPSNAPSEPSKSKSTTPK